MEWMICLPCLFLSNALHLYLAGALLAWTVGLCVRRFSFAARLRGLANWMITLTGITLFFIFTTPWLLIPGALFATTRLAVVLIGTPLIQQPVWVLVTLAAFRSFTACVGRTQHPLRQEVR